LRFCLLTSALVLPKMTSAAPGDLARRGKPTGSCVRKSTDGVTGIATPGPVASAVLEVRDPADQRCVVAEVPAMGADDVAAT
jgi:hypothetical protein